jgi:hypothetical protein
MTRARLVDTAGLVLLILAAWVWWIGLPEPVDPTAMPPLPEPAQPSSGAVRAAQGVLVALLGSCAVAAIGALVTRPRRPERVVLMTPALLVVLGLTGAQLLVWGLVVTGSRRTLGSTLIGLTAPSSVAVIVAAAGVALLLAAVPMRPREVAALLLAVSAVALVIQEAGIWWSFAEAAEAMPQILYLLPNMVVVVAMAVGALALAVGLRRESGTLAREVAMGATVTWGAVIVASGVVPMFWWERLSGELPEPFFGYFGGLGPFGGLGAIGFGSGVPVGAVALLAAPAGAVLVARVRTPAAREVVTLRWRGACGALAVLLLDRATAPLGLLLLWWDQAMAEVGAPAFVWFGLSVSAAVGFAIAAFRRDAGPPIAVAAALLAVLSVVVGRASDDLALVLVPEPLVVGVLAPLTVAIALVVRAVSARRDRRRPEPSGEAEPEETRP